MNAGDHGWMLFAAALFWLGISVFNDKADEWQCEKDFNVYDCEYEWYPVYDEMSPEDEELMP